MKTELLTISKIFNEALFRIPDYQRGYSWEESHLKDFWSDIEQLDHDKSHYTGVITLEEVPETAWCRWEDDAWIIRSKRYSPYYVVDGQQRLTTVVILLQCIIEKTVADELNYTPLEIIRRKYIFETRSDKLARAYIFGYEKDNPSREFLRSEIFADHPDGHSNGEATVYTRNLRNAKKFFCEKLEGFSHSGLEGVFSKVTQQLVFNAYEISKEIDVFVAFETMNNRGKPLSALELLKNRLIYLSANVPEPEPGDGKLLRKQINDSWAVVYHNLGRNEKRPLSDDDFLRAHLSNYYHQYLSGEIPTDDDQLSRFNARSYMVLEESSDFLLGFYFTRRRLSSSEGALPVIDATELQKYAQDLRKSAETYFKISTPELSGYTQIEIVSLERLGRLRGYGASPLMLALYRHEVSTKQRAALLAAYERYLFCGTLRGGYRALDRGRSGLPIEVIKYLKNGRKVEELISYFNNLVDQIFKEDSVADALADWAKNGSSYYGWRSIRYFLYEYELSLQEQSRTGRSKIEWSQFSKEDYQSDYISVEHIYPQRPRATYWMERFSGYTVAQRRMLRNSIGNLLALSTPKNSSLGNKSFPEKIGNGDGAVGYRYGSYSENQVAIVSEWTPDAIVERGLQMMSFMEKRWSLTIGDREQKLRAMGLGFMARRA